jgi:ribonuclease HIII
MDYKKDFNPQIIGSDEVGVGDYFGPLVVCAVKIQEKNLDKVIALNIRDSKVLSDAQIVNLARQVKPLVSHSIR